MMSVNIVEKIKVIAKKLGEARNLSYIERNIKRK